MIPTLLVRHFRELTKEFLINRTHRVVINNIWMEIEFSELVDQEIETFILVEFLNERIN